MRSEGAALLAGLREGIRNPSHVIKCREKFQKKKLGARGHRSPPGELKPGYQCQVLQLPLSAFLRKHGHKSKKPGPRIAMSRALCTTARGRYLQFTSPEVSRHHLIWGRGIPFQDSTPSGSRAILLRPAESARLACPLGTIVAPGGCLQHRPVRANA
jgi:hypothetical protein